MKRAAFAGLLAACAPRAEPSPHPVPPSVRVGVPRAVNVTLLYTSDEHGWLLPVLEEGRALGGAAEVLNQWILGEGHCVVEPCPEGRPIALSGGDNWTGPAISTFSGGRTMAQAMGRMGYVASAFGNHEFDFGRERFVENRRAAGLTYLAANVRVNEGGPTEVQMPPFVVLQRDGVKIGVVGLATERTLTSAMASRFEGLTFEPEESALARTIPLAWAAGSDAVILVAHECPDELEPILARHPEWRLSFVGAGHCHKTMEKVVGGVHVIAPGWRLRQYVRVRLTLDPSRPARERVTHVEPALVEVSRAEGELLTAPAALLLSREIAAANQEVVRELGEPIGFSTRGMEQRSEEMGRWVTKAWREELGVEITFLNRGGLRQAVPAGVITKATVWSVLPFDNRLFTMDLPGDALLGALAHDEVMVSGASRVPKGDRWIGPDKAPIDPAKSYRVATIDYLYFGGAGFELQGRARNTKDVGIDWRAPVIAWTKKQKSSPTAPLERVLREPKAP